MELEILPAPKLAVMMCRLAHQLVEAHLSKAANDVCLIGIQPRGILLARRIREVLKTMPSTQDLDFLYGELDVTFFRDDHRRQDKPILPNSTQIDFIIEDKTVILIDDVLYTGRTVRAAMDALLAFGRPKRMELMVLIDRLQKREVPVEAQYVGIAVDTLDNEKVIVQWQEKHGVDSVKIIAANK